MGGEWRNSTWGEEISLEYGKSLKDYRESDGKIQVFGSNGAVGWTDKALTDGPGVILGRKGAYRGVRYSEDPFFVIDTAYYVKPKTDHDMRWLYYSIIHHKLGEIDDGSPIPSTTRSAVYVTEVDVPTLPEQKAIAHILGSLDDKIELNRRMNATLEGMAQALFKSWFVDFDPVIDNALAAGNPIPDELADRAEVRRQALANGTANREAAKAFPAAFQQTESMGWIPEEWDVNTIEEIAARVAMGPFGSSIKVSTFVDSGIPVISGQHLKETTLDDNTYNYVTEDHAEKLKRSNVYRGDIIFTHAGNIGQVALIPESSKYERGGFRLLANKS